LDEKAVVVLASLLITLIVIMNVLSIDILSEQERATSLLESSYSVVVKLADQQADANSPLYSVKSFEDLGL
jgi:hypothetical protein